MGLAVDTAHPWRSAAFSGIPVVRVRVPRPVRGVVNDNHAVEAGMTDKTCKAWLDDVVLTRLSDIDAVNAITTGRLVAEVEIGSVENKSVDDARAYFRTMRYTYTGQKKTQIHLTHAGKHIVVRPRVDGTVVDAMYSAPSVDKWIQAAGIKLPRVVAAPRVTGSVAGMPSHDPNAIVPTSSEFEGLRKTAAMHAKSDDYGDRLFNLARVVCHSRVAKIVRREHEVTPYMHKSKMYSILSANTPNLTAADIRTNVYLYTHTDDTEEYRAFLAMGVHGMHNYAGSFESIYSECRVEAEATLKDDVVFIRVGGEQPNVVSPTTGAYLRVLDNPELCVAFYYAYARSMGLGESATAVLIQTAHAPHMWLDQAISPYKNCRPKLDACRYAILPDDDTAYTTLTSTKGLIQTAAITAQAYKAGLGCLVMGFKSGKDVDEKGVVSQWMERLADPELRRTIARAVCNRMNHGNVGLEWFTPFSYDARGGYAECVEAWRESGYLLGLYRTCPVSSVTACFTTGVDMANAMIGKKMVDRPNAYAQVVMCALMAGGQLPGMCEPITTGLANRLNGVAPGLRSWVPVVTVTRFTGLKPHNAKMEDTPERHPVSELLEPSTLSGGYSGGTHSRVVSSDAAPSTTHGAQESYENDTKDTELADTAIQVRSPPTTRRPTRPPSAVTSGKASTVRLQGITPLDIERNRNIRVELESDDEQIEPPLPTRIQRQVRVLEHKRSSSSSMTSLRELTLGRSAGLKQATAEVASDVGTYEDATNKSGSSTELATKSAGTMKTTRTKTMDTQDMPV